MMHGEALLEPPFVRWAAWYDALYGSQGRDPEKEVAVLRPTLEATGAESRHRRILDVGCGTGRHWPALSRFGRVTGIDRCPEMIAVARERYPEGDWRLGGPFQLANEERFHAVLMLFGVCGYARTETEAQELLRQSAARLHTGGVLVAGVEIVRESLKPAQARTVRVEQSGKTLIRHSIAEVRRTPRMAEQLVTTFTFCDGDGTPMWREEHAHLIASRAAWEAWLGEAVASVGASWRLLVGGPSEPESTNELGAPCTVDPNVFRLHDWLLV